MHIVPIAAFVNNSINKIYGLYLLMVFNKSFLLYDTIDGAKCQTIDKTITQHAAPIEKVKNWNESNF